MIQRNYRKYRLAKKYGMTEADYEHLLNAQNGCCAICSERERLYIDHDHATGRVRGLLCNLCNLAIGKFRDSPMVLRAAAAYIERTA